MFTKRAFAIRIIGDKHGAAGVARMAAARPSRGCIAVWRRNPVSGRLELRWQPAPASTVRSDVDDVATRAAA